MIPANEHDRLLRSVSDPSFADHELESAPDAAGPAAMGQSIGPDGVEPIRIDEAPTVTPYEAPTVTPLGNLGSMRPTQIMLLAASLLEASKEPADRMVGAALRRKVEKFREASPAIEIAAQLIEKGSLGDADGIDFAVEILRVMAETLR